MNFAKKLNERLKCALNWRDIKRLLVAIIIISLFLGSLFSSLSHSNWLLQIAGSFRVVHDRSAAPSRCTVQAPHIAMPQPNFVPFSFSSSRITQSNGVSGALSEVTVSPLSSNSIMIPPRMRFGDSWCSLVQQRPDRRTEREYTDRANFIRIVSRQSHTV